jgi:decaprenyl-phosphate phosphoribosyltransferase
MTQTAPTEPLVRAAVRGMRPRQWIKNLLVFAAPVTAGRLQEPGVLVPTLLTFVLFCAVSSGVYLFNDARDVTEDRRHPTKRFRPVASGGLPVRSAYALSAVLVVGALVGSYLVALELGYTITTYVVIQALYTLGLRHQPVLDLACVASGFLLRAIAGGAATGIDLSQWFLLVASFGSLFVVAGKRYSELHVHGSSGETRRALSYYSESYLRFVWSLAAGATLVFYGLWAFETGTDASWAVISVAPWTLGLLRYAVDIDRGLAGSPEDIVLRDWVLQVIGAVWLVLIVLSATTTGSA